MASTVEFVLRAGHLADHQGARESKAHINNGERIRQAGQLSLLLNAWKCLDDGFAEREPALGIRVIGAGAGHLPAPHFDFCLGATESQVAARRRWLQCVKNLGIKAVLTVATN